MLRLILLSLATCGCRTPKQSSFYSLATEQVCTSLNERSGPSVNPSQNKSGEPFLKECFYCKVYLSNVNIFPQQKSFRAGALEGTARVDAPRARIRRRLRCWSPHRIGRYAHTHCDRAKRGVILCFIRAQRLFCFKARRAPHKSLRDYAGQTPRGVIGWGNFYPVAMRSPVRKLLLFIFLNL